MHFKQQQAAASQPHKQPSNVKVILTGEMQSVCILMVHALNPISLKFTIRSKSEKMEKKEELFS